MENPYCSCRADRERGAPQYWAAVLPFIVFCVASEITLLGLAATHASAEVSRGLQLQPPMANPYRSCEPTRCFMACSCDPLWRIPTAAVS